MNKSLKQLFINILVAICSAIIAFFSSSCVSLWIKGNDNNPVIDARPNLSSDSTNFIRLSILEKHPIYQEFPSNHEANLGRFGRGGEYPPQTSLGGMREIESPLPINYVLHFLTPQILKIPGRNSRST